MSNITLQIISWNSYSMLSVRCLSYYRKYGQFTLFDYLCTSVKPMKSGRKCLQTSLSSGTKGPIKQHRLSLLHDCDPITSPNSSIVLLKYEKVVMGEQGGLALLPSPTTRNASSNCPGPAQLPEHKLGSRGPLTCRTPKLCKLNMS